MLKIVVEWVGFNSNFKDILGSNSRWKHTTLNLTMILNIYLHVTVYTFNEYMDLSAINIHNLSFTEPAVQRQGR
jgi:hypothetical protein